MDKVFSLMLLAVITAILALFLKKDTEHIGIILTIVCGITILIFAINIYNDLFKEFNNLINSLELSSFLDFGIIKAVGIAILTRISSELCRDAGSLSLAAKVEFLGVGAGVIVLMPLINKVLNLINGML